MLMCYIYGITFAFFPISTKIILELVGFLLCFKYLGKIRKEYKTIITFLGLIVLWDVLTSMANGCSEFYLIKKTIQAIGSFFAANLIYNVMQKVKPSFYQLLWFVVLAIFFESLISLLMYIVEPLNNFMQTFLANDFEDDPDVLEKFLLQRFVGIGNAKFFGVLPSCAVGLFTSLYLYAKVKSSSQKIILLFIWLFVLVISFLTARYSMVLGALSLMFLLYVQGRISIGKIIVLSLFSFIFLYAAYCVIIEYAGDAMVAWAFGSFDGSGEGGGSVEQVLYWWTETEVEFKTLIMGDARYTDPVTTYYKGVDVGIFRQIFYGGIIGLLLNILGHYKILKLAYLNYNDKTFKIMLMFLLVSYVAILGKGDTNMMSYFVLYLIFSTNGIIKNKYAS